MSKYNPSEVKGTLGSWPPGQISVEPRVSTGLKHWKWPEANRRSSQHIRLALSNPYANHGAGIFTYIWLIFLGPMLGNIPYIHGAYGNVNWCQLMSLASESVPRNSEYLQKLTVGCIRVNLGWDIWLLHRTFIRYFILCLQVRKCSNHDQYSIGFIQVIQNWEWYCYLRIILWCLPSKANGSNGSTKHVDWQLCSRRRSPWK